MRNCNGFYKCVLDALLMNSINIHFHHANCENRLEKYKFTGYIIHLIKGP